MGSTQPFRVTGTVTLAATTTSAQAALMGLGSSAVIYNASADVAFVEFGPSGAVTASLASFPVPPGGRALVYIGPMTSGVAVILSTGTGAVYVSRGDGDAY